MKSSKNNTSLFRIDLACLVLVIFLFHVIIAYAQSGLSQGEKMFNEKNYYGAERYFSEAIDQDSKNAEAWYWLGRIAFDKEKSEQAIEYFNKAVDLDPDNSTYHTWKGINYVRLLSQVDFMKQGVYAPRALNSLEKAVTLDEKNIEARIYLAGYYANAPVFAGGSREKAVNQFNEIFRLDPDHKGALLQHGIMMTNFEKYDQARESLEKLMQLDNNYFSAFFYMGRLSSESNQYAEQGELSLKKFIDLAPEEFESSKDEAWWYLGNIYRCQGKMEKAKNAYEKALALEPENEEYQKSLKNIL